MLPKFMCNINMYISISMFSHINLLQGNRQTEINVLTSVIYIILYYDVSGLYSVNINKEPGKVASVRSSGRLPEMRQQARF